MIQTGAGSPSGITVYEGDLLPAVFRNSMIHADAGGRHVMSHGPFPGVAQPDPPVGERRLRECAWAPCLTLKVPDDWVSGVYLGRLSTLPDSPEIPYSWKAAGSS